MNINFTDPESNGVYVAYVDHENGGKFAAKIILVFQDGEWYYLGSDQRYRGEVHGWIGPLPSLRFE